MYPAAPAVASPCNEWVLGLLSFAASEAGTNVSSADADRNTAWLLAALLAVQHVNARDATYSAAITNSLSVTFRLSWAAVSAGEQSLDLGPALARINLKDESLSTGPAPVAVIGPPFSSQAMKASSDWLGAGSTGRSSGLSSVVPQIGWWSTSAALSCTTTCAYPNFYRVVASDYQTAGLMAELAQKFWMEMNITGTVKVIGLFGTGDYSQTLKTAFLAHAATFGLGAEIVEYDACTGTACDKWLTGTGGVVEKATAAGTRIVVHADVATQTLEIARSATRQGLTLLGNDGSGWVWVSGGQVASLSSGLRESAQDLHGWIAVGQDVVASGGAKADALRDNWAAAAAGVREAAANLTGAAITSVPPWTADPFIPAVYDAVVLAAVAADRAGLQSGDHAGGNAAVKVNAALLSMADTAGQPGVESVTGNIVLNAEHDREGITYNIVQIDNSQSVGSRAVPIGTKPSTGAIAWMADKEPSVANGMLPRAVAPPATAAPTAAATAGQSSDDDGIAWWAILIIVIVVLGVIAGGLFVAMRSRKSPGPVGDFREQVEMLEGMEPEAQGQYNSQQQQPAL